MSLLVLVNLQDAAFKFQRDSGAKLVPSRVFSRMPTRKSGRLHTATQDEFRVSTLIDLSRHYYIKTRPAVHMT